MVQHTIRLMYTYNKQVIELQNAETEFTETIHFYTELSQEQKHTTSHVHTYQLIQVCTGPPQNRVKRQQNKIDAKNLFDSSEMGLQKKLFRLLDSAWNIVQAHNCTSNG